MVEQRPMRDRPLKPRGVRGGEALRPDVETFLKFPDPLIHQMGRAEYRAPRDLAPVQQLPDDQSRLDRLADAHVGSDEHSGNLLLQGHHQGNELIGAGFDRHVSQRPEGSRPRAKLQHRSIAQQPGAVMGSGPSGIRRREERGFRTLQLQGSVEHRRVLAGASKRTQL